MSDILKKFKEKVAQSMVWLKPLLLIIILLLTIGLSILFALSVTNQPKKVRVTNITGTSASVSWITDRKDIGRVVVKESGESFGIWPFNVFQKDGVYYDDRDVADSQLRAYGEWISDSSETLDATYSISAENSGDLYDYNVTKKGKYFIHHVTVLGLNENTDYEFLVGNGSRFWSYDSVDQKVSKHDAPITSSFTFSTFSHPTGIPTPSPAYGSVSGVVRDGGVYLTEDYNKDSVVFYRVASVADGSETNILSAVTNSLGGWVVDRSSLRSQNGDPYRVSLFEDRASIWFNYENIEPIMSATVTIGIEDEPLSTLLGNTEATARSEQSFTHSISDKIKIAYYSFFEAESISTIHYVVFGLLLISAFALFGLWLKKSGTKKNRYLALFVLLSSVSALGVSLILMGSSNLSFNVIFAAKDSKKNCIATSSCKDFAEYAAARASTAEKGSSEARKWESRETQAVQNPAASVNTSPCASGADFCALSGCSSCICSAFVDGVCKNIPAEFSRCESIPKPVSCGGTGVGIVHVSPVQPAAPATSGGTTSTGFTRPRNMLDDDWRALCMESLGGTEAECGVSVTQTPKDRTPVITRPSNMTNDKWLELCVKEFGYTQSECNVSYSEPVIPVGGTSTGGNASSSGIKTPADVDATIAKVMREANCITPAQLQSDICKKLYFSLKEVKTGVPNGPTVPATGREDKPLKSIELKTKVQSSDKICSEKNRPAHNLSVYVTTSAVVATVSPSGMLCTSVEVIEAAAAPAVEGLNVISSGADIVYQNNVNTLNTLIKINNVYVKVLAKTILPRAANQCVYTLDHGFVWKDTISAPWNVAIESNGPQDCDSKNSLKPVPTDNSEDIVNEDITSSSKWNNNTLADSLERSGINFVQTVKASDATEDAAYAQSGSVFFFVNAGAYKILTEDSEFMAFANADEPTIVYAEKNNIFGYQEGADVLITDISENIRVEKVNSSFKHNLKKGMNIISFPYLPSLDGKTPISGAEFINIVNQKHDNIALLTQFENGTWEGGLVAPAEGETIASGRDFPLQFGKGYLIVSNFDTTIEVPGFDILDPIPLAFKSGWNLVGVHGYNTPYTAHSFASSISALGTVTADNVTKWDTAKGRYEGIQISQDTLYGFDYPIQQDLGYFVRISEFKPTSPDSLSIIWAPGTDKHGTEAK